MSATYAVATLLLAYPALFGRFLVNSHSDQYIAGYAFREFAARWMRAGDGVPQWNPYQFGGMPYVAGMHGDIFYPTFLLRALLPTDVAMTWGFIIHVFLAGLFAYLFLRAMGLGFAGALVGGLAYMLGGNVAGLVSPGHDGKLFIAALLPLALLFVHRAVRDGRPWAWGALAITITLAVLTPHPQLLQYLLLVAGAYALFVAFSTPDGRPALSRALALRRLAMATGAVALGMAGGTIQYLPALSYAPWSPRAGGMGWEHAISYSMPPEELVNTYLPQFSGILELYSGRNSIHLHSEYIGAAVLVLAGLAFAVPAARRSLVWFWTGTLTVATLWALGGFTPFFRVVYAVVPGTQFFRAPSTMLYVVAFCVAILAAFGVDRAVARKFNPRYAIAWIAAAFVIAILATTGMLAELATAFAPPQRAAVVDANATNLILGAWRSLLAVAAAAGVLLAMNRKIISASVGMWALVAVVALDLWSVERHYWRFSAPAAELYAADPVIDHLKNLTQPGRVAPLALENLSGTMRDPYFGGGDGRAAGFMVHEIRSAVGYHGNELGRYDALTGWDNDWPRRLGSANLRKLLNLRFIYTNSARAPAEGMRLVAGPAKNAAGNITYLYEFPEENPAAWVVPIALRAPDEDVLDALLDPRFDVRRAALLDPSAPITTPPVPSTLPPPSDVGARVTTWQAGRISIELDAPAPAGAILLVAENFYPGWQAAIDGQPADVVRADYVLIGVPLPTNARTVNLVFRDATYERGKAITLACLGVAILLLGGGTLLSLPRRVTPPTEPTQA